MDVTDPRERFDDLRVERTEYQVDESRFADLESSEAFVSGWVTTAVVLDDAGRVLLAYDAEEDHWLVPGGTVQPGETLREAVVRELAEETGVPVIPDRPHAVSDVVAVYGGESATFRVVTFEATPKATTVGDDLGVGDERITEAGWFERLPQDTFERDHAAEMLERIRGG